MATPVIKYSDQITSWIKEKRQCRKCGRAYKPDKCTLNKPCHTCKEVRLTIRHETAQKTTSRVFRVQTSIKTVNVDRPVRPHGVMLEVCPFSFMALLATLKPVPFSMIVLKDVCYSKQQQRPHHTVHHNGKYRLVFNCSFQYNKRVLNECILLGH